MVFSVNGTMAPRRNAMLSFLSKFASVVRGVLCGFDRLSLVGSLRCISYPLGFQNYLWWQSIPFKHFAQHNRCVSAQLEEASLRHARQHGREIRYLNSSQHRKEDIARGIAERDRIKNGLICVLRSVDPCMSFEMRKNAATGKLEIKYRQRKCIHLYHYQMHPIFGFMHARIQTWFPFRVYVCINGREWLARQMDQARMKYMKRENTFTWLEDVAAAQTLFNQQLQADWPTLLGGLVEALNPTHREIFSKFDCKYYWSVEDSEWASDVMFRSRAALEAVYPRLLRYAVTSFTATDVLRFLGQPLGANGTVPHRCRHEVSTNLKERLEGTRLKHWLNYNSIKMYDKSSVLRCETLIHDPENFQVIRPPEGDPDGLVKRRPLRKGIVDLPHRATVSQAANERYLEALTAVHDDTPVRDWVEPLCRPVTDVPKDTADTATTLPAETPSATTDAALKSPASEPAAAVAQPRRLRALNPLAAADVALLAAVGRHEFFINGLRNRDLCRLLFGTAPVPADEKRKRSAAVTRKLRLLRAHGLLNKMPGTHRYVVPEAGRQAITALLAIRNASTDQLIRSAA
jgi:hypothetical protein